MPAWFYFDRPINLAFHDLTTTAAPPRNLRSLLGLGHKFCPTPRFSASCVKDIFTRYHHDFYCKIFYAGQDFGAESTYDPKMYINSDWTPTDWMIPTSAVRRYNNFRSHVVGLYKKRHVPSNLLRHQLLALKYLQVQKEFLIVQCDKNLGPAILEYDVYVRRALNDHLLKTTTYRQLNNQQARNYATKISDLITCWLKKHHDALLASERKYIRTRVAETEEPFPVFYLTMKVHKNPWATRPIVSCSGSLLYSLAVWVDRKLQSAAVAQKSYISSSKGFKDYLFANSPFPANAKIFTADAESYYTAINTNQALREIGSYLRANERTFKDIPVQALMSGLRLIMKYNVFTFGDTHWLQLSGTAMGTPPACNYATLFLAIHEERILPSHPNVRCYKRYIDDVCGIWIPSDDATIDNNNWTMFQSDMHNYHGIKWDFQPLGSHVDFLDITIHVTNGVISTTLFEKALNLYLYISPHSCHPPGVLTGLVLGNCHRIYTLCSDRTDTETHLRNFYRRLRRRGYTSSILLPLFQRAHELATTTRPSPTDVERLDSRIFFHTRYNPRNPPSSQLQRGFATYIMHPPYERPLTSIKNNEGYDIPIEKMTVAYSRPHNLGNLLSYRKLNASTGPSVSSYIP